MYYLWSPIPKPTTVKRVAKVTNGGREGGGESLRRRWEGRVDKAPEWQKGRKSGGSCNRQLLSWRAPIFNMPGDRPDGELR